MTQEFKGQSFPGMAMIGVLFALQVLSIASIAALPGALKVLAVLATVVVAICWIGFYMVQPNQGRVLQFFGRYSGTDRNEGLRWANPLYTKKAVSLRVRNFESGRLKVNDANGNPIEIAAVIVWRVVDTAEAVFEVDNYENYVTIQSESALRNLATSYPYEDHSDDDSTLSLRSNANAIACRRPAWKCWRRGSAIWPTPRKSRRPCCSASRPVPCWRPARSSCRAPWAWCRPRWTS